MKHFFGPRHSNVRQASGSRGQALMPQQIRNPSDILYQGLEPLQLPPIRPPLSCRQFFGYRQKRLDIGPPCSKLFFHTIAIFFHNHRISPLFQR
jgi:hypothetical protein